MADLFDRDVRTIGKHIQNVMVEELKDISVVAKFATTEKDNKVYIVEYYSLKGKPCAGWFMNFIT